MKVSDMSRINLPSAACAFVVLSLAVPAAAQPAPAARAGALKALADCRAVTDSTARLACYDAAAAQLDEAERTGEVVVLDREQVRTAKRDAFGFSIPSFPRLFDRDERQASEEVNTLASEVASASKDAFGRWSVSLKNGQQWRQTDSKTIFRVRTGDAVEVRRGLVGSFFIRIGGQPGVRAERVR